MQNWLLNAAKFVGLSHIASGKPCQDDVNTLKKNGVSAIVLSDGCGSAPLAEYGSRLTVKEIGEYLCDNFDDLCGKTEREIKTELTAHILKRVNAYAKNNSEAINKFFDSEKGRSYKKTTLAYDIMKYLSREDASGLLYSMLFDATLLFVAIKGDRALVGHCGDGFIVGRKNDAFRIISEEPKSEEVNKTHYPSSVYYLSKGYKNTAYWEFFRIQKINPEEYSGFILMSDGAESSLISYSDGIPSPREGNNALLFKIVVNETAERATEYLTDLLEKTYRRRKNADGEMMEITDDDVSVAVLVADSYTPAEQVKPKPEPKLEIPEETDALLRSYLTVDGRLDEQKYGRLKAWFAVVIDKVKKKLTLKELVSVIENNVELEDDDDLAELIRYLLLCRVISI